MKKAIANFLLGRGIGKLQEIVSKGVRHGLTIWGGWAAAHGYLATGDLVTLESASTILVGVGLSIARTFLAAKLAE